MNHKRRQPPWKEQPCERGHCLRRSDDVDGFRNLLPPVERGATAATPLTSTAKGRETGRLREQWNAQERPSTVSGRIDTVPTRTFRLSQRGEEQKEEKNKEKSCGFSTPPPPQRRVALRDRPKTVAATRRRNKYKRLRKRKKARIPNYNPWIVVRC